MTENQQQGLAGLFKKISIIQGELGAVKKGAKHQQGYNYHSAEDVMSALNPLLTKYSLVIIPSALPNVQVVQGADGLTRWVVNYEFTIACGETGAYWTAQWASEGVMSVGREANEQRTPKPDDKSMGKTHTYALKYWLIQLFKVTTKDMVDLDQNDQDEGESKPKTTPHVVEKPASTGNTDEKYTAAITKVDVKLNKNSKPYIVAGGVTLNTRDAFRALNYDDAIIERLGKVGAVDLPDGIVIAYVTNERGYKEPTAIQRPKTGETYEVAAA